ncbi:site-specific integrase [Lonepinella koalarum]|uniref:Site-specific recombinase XerD n=1 Tax=Lonepinella koalarum TaxID=53417 RepID=A0A4R1KSF9_9PAST|nr:site-specific integrase [Lonepinella koalarum]MDH2925607.1 integrase [Lonepinella koalarum]TCK67199.1 site-specific recombinase XerD [Lonepinella koalarum]TFJ89144.1 site-specific integrase [Lonepinella koalarum]
MSIYKKSNGIWWIDFRTPSGQRIRHSAKTTEKKLAQEYHDKLKHEAWQIERLNKKPERTIEEALIRFLEVSQEQKDIETKIRHTEYWRSVLAGRTLSSLTTDDILNNLPTHKTGTKKKLSPATQNRYRTSILRALSLAHKAGWIDSVPYVPKNPEPKLRVRWLSKEQALQLINALSLQWMKEVCSFALMTGARMTEILSLTWDKIDFARNIAIVSSDIAKSGKARALPLSREAITLLRKRQSQQLAHYVFHRGKGKYISEIDREDFQRALTKANIQDFRFHDLRHTWASWHVQNGTPLMVLKELGGWETVEMVKRYAHLNATHLLNYASVGTFWEQSTITSFKFTAENDPQTEPPQNKKAVSY